MPTSGRSRPRGQGFEHVEQHGLGEFGASRLIENRGETLLGAGEIFDRNQNHGRSEPAWAALSEVKSATDLAGELSFFFGGPHDGVGAVNAKSGLL